LKMATKKSTSAAKKSTTKKTSTTAKPATTTTKVTTVKAVEARPTTTRKSFSFSRMPLLGAAIAEFIGTFLLATAIVSTGAQAQGQAIIALFALTGIVLVIGGLSGAHVNPAITVGAWVTKRISGVRAISYIVAQILGAMLALVVLSSYVHAAPAVSAQAQMYGQSAASLLQVNALPQGKEWSILFAELLGTTIFAFAFARTFRNTRDSIASAFTIGFGFFLGLMIAGYAVNVVGGGAVLNPALAIAEQAFTKLDVWTVAVYALIPLIGGVIGFALNDLLRSAKADEVTSTEEL
jgi:aquaporin Z